MHVPEALPHHELAVARELEHVKDKLLELDAVVGGRLLGGVGLGVVEGDLLVRHVLRQFLEVLPECQFNKIKTSPESNYKGIFGPGWYTNQL